MKILKRKWSLVILLISFTSIASALIAEHFYDILPCDMCLHQRYTYYFLIMICAIFLLIKKIYFFWQLIIIKIALIYGFFFAFWHVGIEQKLLPSFLGCSNKISNAESITDLKNKILDQSIVACDEITWTIMGLSAATINLLVLLSLIIFNTIFLVDLLYGKEKNQ